jgi:LacI family transcriptional regulator
MTPPRMKEVADYAQVSKATVSRVLNRDPHVADALRLRVEEAIRVLGYQPNRAARRLRGTSTDVIGLIISDIQNPYFTSVVRGVEDAAYENHMNIVLCNTDEDPMKEQRYLSVMWAERVAGLIVVPSGNGIRNDLLRMRQANIPVVFMDRTLENFEVDAVTVDNIRGSFGAVKHLITIGYRRIGIIGGVLTTTTGKERLQGYRDALIEEGISLENELIKTGNFKIDGGYQVAAEFIASARPPEAIFIANNLMTLGALRALHETGIEIPGDMAVVGFDDMPWSGELCPPLTAVSQPTYELGQEAVHLLLRRLSMPDAPFRTVTLQTRLIVRESCGAQLRRSS